MGDRGKIPSSPRLTKARTFSVTERSSVDPERSSSSLTGRSKSKSDKHIPTTLSGAQDHQSSILDDSTFGPNYAYGVADGAAFNPTEPWKVMGAVGRDFGQFVLGRFGWKPSSAEPECDESMFKHQSCAIMKARLKKQAADRAVSASKVAPVPEEEGTESQEKPISRPQVEKDSDSNDDNQKSNGAQVKPEQDNDLSRVSTTSSAASADITASGSGHYDPRNDAILRLETMTAAEVRFLNIALWTWLSIALVFLVYEFVVKLMDPNAAVKTYNTAIINSVMGGLCFVLISGSFACHITRLVQTLIYKKTWKPRRTKFTIYVTVELAAQWLNLLFFILPNLESFGPRCFRVKSTTHVAAFSFVRWTAWNTIFLVSLIHAHNANAVKTEVALASSLAQKASLQDRKSLRRSDTREDMAVMDLPILQAHWWKFILWGMMECSVIACTVYYAVTVGKYNPNISKLEGLDSLDCAKRPFNCRSDNTSIGLVSIMVFFALLYFGLYCFFIQKSFQHLKTKSNTNFKIANIIVRLQMRLRLPAFGFFILSLLLLWYVDPFSCTSTIFTWYGMLPGQLAATVAVMLVTFVGTPKSCGGQKPILQVWLQEFSWTEAEKSHKMARRNASLPPEQMSEIEKEPMFCVETMMNCLYWSLLVYDCGEVRDSKLSLEEGCALFTPALDEYELFEEKSLDTKMLLAWSRTRMILAFRGTASLANVAADLQAWRMVHEPKRGHWWRRPMVHSGFDKAWRNNNLNKRVISRIKEIMMSGEVDKSKLEFIVTGHSLGGALATLAAYDMRALGVKYGKDCKVTCITFGAPRTGNHAFAEDFQRMVPDCWHIINDQDVVARGAKFGGLYKRGGHRVLINPLGDLIVRPNAMEASLRLVPCSGSVQQHLLTSYLKSLLAVLISQFSKKRMKGGMTGVVQLAKQNVPIKLLLEEAGLCFDDLVYMMRWGAYAPKIAEIADLPINARKKGSLPRDANNRKLDVPKGESTRGGLIFGCCSSTSIMVKDAKDDKTSDATDANVVDGGDVEDADPTSKV